MSALVGYAFSSEASSDHEEEMQQVSVQVQVDVPVSAQPPVGPAAPAPAPTPADAPLEQAAPTPSSAPPVVASEPPQAEKDVKDDQDGDQDDDEDEDHDDDDLTPEPDYSFASPPPPLLDTNGHGHAEDVEQEHEHKHEHEPPQDNNHDYEEQAKEPTKLKATTRIHELDIVQQDIAKLLHLAGCTLASLDPEPNPNLDLSNEKHTPIPEDKNERFDHFAQAYFTTLNDIQLSLRTSIRHLALSKPSLQALLDPNYASLLPTQALEPGQSSIAAGGIAHRSRINPLPLTKSIPKWTTRDAQATSAGGVEEDGSMRLSVAARGLQAEAWRDLARIASAAQDPMKE
ncbi:hypothetical protein MVLG_02878 [Microbotryum lychnidis-dioicae p1A1 Lamole]|uniref:Mediator of RNA polymerase II transcription subunit 11 n=1 Tax=Microbotryum lychnidis-dioicae (strain p1A1 Lamole / MvSl-1064) TaxID=683840 RepID=U5H6H8_USTV1|nr:hypothetical protein MVLG_02878 [Microbotryum lychnidis-dioicae p1A1 Lamole]|eukprot:KDE06842.1 hypothetical protein MVLG_02878 [Microbotryum lychnidis-dioicae p1A1 Lamole]